MPSLEDAKRTWGANSYATLEFIHDATEPVTPSQISQHTGYPLQPTLNALQRLLRARVIARVARGQYVWNQDTREERLRGVVFRHDLRRNDPDLLFRLAEVIEELEQSNKARTVSK